MQGRDTRRGFLNLTQSAVSMQIKRLEDVLGLELLDRTGRRVGLTAAGEQLLGYARRMLALNDEIFGRLTHDAYEGEIVLGVPHDIVYPVIPGVLQRLHAEYPRMKVNLISSFTRMLKDQFARGGLRHHPDDRGFGRAGGRDAGGAAAGVDWRPRGSAWKQRPLRLAYEHNCIFRQGVQAALDTAGVPWEMAVESDSTRAIEASVSADLAVHTVLAGCEGPYLERIAHGGALPDLQRKQINLYVAEPSHSPVVEVLAG